MSASRMATDLKNMQTERKKVNDAAAAMKRPAAADPAEDAVLEAIADRAVLKRPAAADPAEDAVLEAIADRAVLKKPAAAPMAAPCTPRPAPREPVSEDEYTPENWRDFRAHADLPDQASGGDARRDAADAQEQRAVEAEAPKLQDAGPRTPAQRSEAPKAAGLKRGAAKALACGATAAARQSDRPCKRGRPSKASTAAKKTASEPALAPSMSHEGTRSQYLVRTGNTERGKGSVPYKYDTKIKGSKARAEKAAIEHFGKLKVR
jgi:hypothetical protein